MFLFSHKKARRVLKRRRIKVFSPLLRRILLVNIIPLAVLVVTLLYLNQFQSSLITAEVTALREQARIYAGALSQSATGILPTSSNKEVETSPFHNYPAFQEFHLQKPHTPETVLLSHLAEPLLMSLANPSPNIHARLYAPNGQLIVDNREQKKKYSKKTKVQNKTPLISPPPNLQDVFPMEGGQAETLLEKVDDSNEEDIKVEPSLFNTIVESISDHLIHLLFFNRHNQLNIPTEAGNNPNKQPSFIAYPVTDSRETPPYIRRSVHHHLLITVAEPVRHNGKTVGIIQLTRAAQEVDMSLFAVRSSILVLFLLALTITIFLSWYLSRTIARPILRLARVAHDMREHMGRAVTVPQTILVRSDEIGEMARTLQESATALWARIDAIERFAADVSHELKNPLSSIRSAIETLPEIKDSSRQARLLEIVREDVKRMDRLITDISHASRVDAEMSRADIMPVNILPIVQTLSEMQLTTRTETAPHLLVKIPENSQKEDFVVMGIEGRLVQVLRNLIGNAMSFSPPEGKIIIELKRLNKKVEITVTDEGPGIPENKLTSIFDRFYTERPQEEGFGHHSGLGLSISKQIITALKGEIYAENVIDHKTGTTVGARFVILLPAS
ncbi:ATP-binding protein [Entomobacter blattae]|uniref:histidine kinase n=1 Tax=Entomobacter blattae TaxID=2762277 RepID=A0A7H1NPT5_9PROT|nr:ATP-binding protein [Entomobacter blattae]QNT77795.1 Adaptive-response sensory-kinase SasA [Entomobacter blattae]